MSSNQPKPRKVRTYYTTSGEFRLMVRSGCERACLANSFFFDRPPRGRGGPTATDVTVAGPSAGVHLTSYRPDHHERAHILAAGGLPLPADSDPGPEPATVTAPPAIITDDDPASICKPSRSNIVYKIVQYMPILERLPNIYNTYNMYNTLTQY